MRILVISHVAPPHLGGVEQIVLAEVEALLDAGHEVVWITSDAGGDGAEVPERPGLTVERVRAWHVLERRFGVAYPLFSPRLWFVLRRHVKRADLVHLHGLVFCGSIWGSVIARLHRRRTILTDHGGILRYRSKVATWTLRALIETFGRLTARCATKLVALNADLRDLLARLGGDPDKVQFLPNPVDGELFHPPTTDERTRARASLGWDATPRVLSIGRLLPHKGMDLLLEADAPPYRVALCGPGDDTAIERARARGAECLAPRGQRELVPLYHAADVFALPSRNEGFPLVVQEALACGVPVVTTDAPAYEPYRGLPGLHLCPREPRAVHTAIRAALEGPRPTRDALEGSPMQLDARRWLEKLLAD